MIEKIDEEIYLDEYGKFPITKKEEDYDIRDIVYKINEIIDYINEKEGGKTE